MNLALMIIDLQKAFYDDESRHSMDSACEYINAILPVFRKAKLPIFWIQHIDEEDGVVPGTDGFEFISQLQPEGGEHRIHKKYGNSFNKTNCIDIIDEKNIDTVIITGYCAEHCILSTYRGALDHDLTPIILKHGIAGNNQKNTEFVEDISELITYGALKKILEEKL
ncbi:MAG: isochorismatase family protein [Anaerolineales bacterium]|nr:isochorismatase family protein [Anaerolineales bacterium]